MSKRWRIFIGFLFLVPTVFYSQVELLKNHLLFGFSDVDWGFILFYKTTAEDFSNPISNFLYTFKHWGVYAHQSYYIGFQNLIFGLDYKKYQIVTHVFRSLGILLMYPFAIYLSGSILLGLLASLLFAFSYPTVGTMYTVVTSSDYTAVVSFLVFAIYYIYLIKSERNSLFNMIALSGLLMLTLLLSTERFYPIMFVIPFVEYFYNKIKFKKFISKNSVNRLLAMYLPAIIGFLIKPILFIDFIWRGVSDYVDRIQLGDWHVLLTPFISFGSLILPHNYWKYFGVINIGDSLSYFKYLIGTPYIVFGGVTIVISLVVNKKRNFVMRVLIGSTILFYLIFLILKLSAPTFSETLIAPALLGVFYFVVSVSLFVDWLIEPRKEMIGLFLGPLFAFIFIFLTWIASESFLIFTGVHRYLTVPGMGHSLFLATLIYLLIEKISSSKFKILAYVPLLILIPQLLISTEAIRSFFEEHIKHGFGAEDQQNMRKQMLAYLDDYDQARPSLFYFDFSGDQLNGYYYDNTLMGGFKTWMMFTNEVNFNRKIEPSDFWNNMDLLEKISVTADGEEVFLFENKVIPRNNFYAFMLKDKKVVDITDKVLREIIFE